MAAKLKMVKAPTNGTSGASKSPKKPAKGAGRSKEMTAREATLRAWQKTYENRHNRLD